MSNSGIKEGRLHWRLGHAARLLACLLEREEREFIPFTINSYKRVLTVLVSLKVVKNNNKQELKNTLRIL